MFQFTTTNVINTLAQDGVGNLFQLNADKDTLHVYRIGVFKKDNIVAAYKATGYNDVLGTATITIPTSTTSLKDILRLNMYIGLTQGANDAEYSNDMYVKGKPVCIDFPKKDTGANTATNLKKIIDKYMLNIYGEKMFDVSVSGAVVTITLTSGTQRFVKFQVEEFNPTANNGMGEYEVSNSVTTNITEVGNEGFGTYSFLLHNLRLPTEARLAPFSPDFGEMPIPGALYDQITLHMCVNRGILGMNAVGDLVKSKTTHVFYVKNDLTSQVIAVLTQMGIKFDENGEYLPKTTADKIADLQTQIDALS